MYTKEQFIEDLEEARGIVYQAGIHEIDDNSYNLVLNPKYTQWLGKCRRNAYRNYTVFLNQPYANMATHEEIMNTLVHEIAHSAPNCMNHKGPWKAVAQKIYLYNGMKIQRLASTKDNQIVSQYVFDRKEMKYSTPHTYYEITCGDCGKKFHTYERKTKKIERILKLKEKAGYYCTQCHSYNILVNPVVR